MSSRITTGALRTAAPRVIDLRPHAAARRAGVLRELMVARRRRVAPGHQRPLEIVIEVLDRTSWVPEADLEVWERLLAFLEDHPGAHAIPASAATANLAGIAVFGDVLDHSALADLADHLGHRRLARLQHRQGGALEDNVGLPLTTRVVRRLVAPDLQGRLRADLMTEHKAEQVEYAALRAAHALLVQGIDPTWTVPVLETTEELLDIASRGNVVEWRHHVAMVLADPWSSYAERMVDLAEQAGQVHAATVIAAVVDLCREQAAETGLDPVPRETGGLVAVG